MTENSPPIPVPANSNMHASLTLSKVNLYQHSEWNSVITKLIEIKITPEDALRILSTNKYQPNPSKTTVQEQQNPDLSNQSDNLNERKTIIAEFTVTVDLMDVPDEVNLKNNIKFEVVNNYNSGKVVKSEYETVLISSVENIIQMSDNKQSTNENGESIESVFTFLNGQDSSLTENPSIQLDLMDLQKNYLIDTDNEYNILFLGETGTGKSTTINAFANYLKYASFEEAKAGELTQLIPTKFSLFDHKTEKSVVVQSGSDANESHNKMGKFCTQSPVSYLFKNGNNHVRIIDTPGMGNTRGVEVDRENFDQIINFIIHFKNLHGICILIQSNETRKTASFRYCITELLANLHRSACKNIFFCFTFARYTNFWAGDGYLILKSFLSNELHETGLCLNPEVNCFFIDNEAYRYLAAKRQFHFDQDEVDKYDESWTKSSRNTKSMIDSIVKLEPHNIALTRLLNYTQKLTMLLSEPLVLLQQNLYYNIQEFQFHINTFKSLKNSWKSSSQQIEVFIHLLELENLPFAKTVCTESRCVKPVDCKAKDLSCHGICTEIEPQNGIVGSSQLKNCHKMHQDGSCLSCGCNWRKHMRLTAEYKQARRPILKQQVQFNSWSLGNSHSSHLSVDKVLQSLNKQLSYYQARQRELENVCVKLGYLVQKNSNKSFNKFIEPFLDKLIEKESKKIKNLTNYSDEQMQLWMRMKIAHSKRVQELSDMVFRNAAADVKLQQVATFCDKLAQFKPLNQVLLNFNNYQDKETREFKLREIAFEI